MAKVESEDEPSRLIMQLPLTDLGLHDRNQAAHKLGEATLDLFTIWHQSLFAEHYTPLKEAISNTSAAALPQPCADCQCSIAQREQRGGVDSRADQQGFAVDAGPSVAQAEHRPAGQGQHCQQQECAPTA